MKKKIGQVFFFPGAKCRKIFIPGGPGNPPRSEGGRWVVWTFLPLGGPPVQNHRLLDSLNTLNKKKWRKRQETFGLKKIVFSCTFLESPKKIYKRTFTSWVRSAGGKIFVSAPPVQNQRSFGTPENIRKVTLVLLRGEDINSKMQYMERKFSIYHPNLAVPE